MSNEREKAIMSLAWTRKRTAHIPMNNDLVQSVAHILVRECLQARLDELERIAAGGDIPTRMRELAKLLADHEREGQETGRSVTEAFSGVVQA